MILGFETATEARHLLDELPLLKAEFLRDNDLEMHMQIATPAAVDIGHAGAVNSEDLSRLGPGRDLDGGILLQNRHHLDVGAQYRLVDRNRKLHVEVVIVPFENIVRCHSNDDKKITSSAAERSALPLPRQPETHAVVHTGRHVDLQGRFALDPSPPAAGFTRVAVDTSGAGTGGAGLGRPTRTLVGT